MLIIPKLGEPSERNTDVRDRQALLVLDARTHRMSTNEGVGFMVAMLAADGKKTGNSVA